MLVLGRESSSWDDMGVCSDNIKRNGQCLACVYPIRDARGYLREHEGSTRDARSRRIREHP